MVSLTKVLTCLTADHLRYDILVSTFWTCRPTYPAKPLSPILRPLKSSPADITLDEVLGFLRTFANLLDGNELEGRPAQPTFTDVFIVRFQIQHCILDLPKSVLRTAFLLLSELCIIPMAPQVDHQQRLSTELQSEMGKNSEEVDEVREFWCLAIGGIGAIGSTRAWFIQRLADLCQKQDIKALADVRKRISDVLWCQVAFTSATSLGFWRTLANALDTTFSPEDDEWKPKKPPSFADSYTLIQTLVSEYVL